jgi:DNA polymerase-4
MFNDVCYRPFVATILHVDLDAFYASVEQRDDPSLVGKPVLVGGHHRRGVVLAASYEIRPFGVRSAMPMVEALRLCPKAIVLSPRMDHYAEISQDFFAILNRYSPSVEGLSLDEAFLDVSGEERLFGDGPTIARKIKDAVRTELRLVASVGVAPIKFAAKIASDVGKPDGLLVVDDVVKFLHPLPVGRLWGVGKKTEELLARLGLKTIGDVARAGEAQLRPSVGPHAARHLLQLAQGLDDRTVVADRAPVSIGHEDTFDRDHFDRPSLATKLLDQADRVCARVRARHWRARTITLKVKYADHQRISRRITLSRATSDGSAVGKAAVELLREVPDIEGRGVRLTGVSLSQFEPSAAPEQLELGERIAHDTQRSDDARPNSDAGKPRGDALGAALDKIHEKFGDRAIGRADHLRKP